MLAAMFSGRYAVKQQEDGSYFLDRNGKVFGLILDWLRNPTVLPKWKDEAEREMLLEEAEYYQLEGLIEMMEMKWIKVFVSGFRSDKGVPATDKGLAVYSFPQGSKIRHLKYRLEKERIKPLSIDNVMEGTWDSNKPLALSQVLTDGSRWQVGHKGIKGSYRWAVENFTNITEPRVTSPRFVIGDITWFLLLHPDLSSYIGLFLSVESSSMLQGWSVPATFELKIINQTDPTKNYTLETTHRFTAEEFDRGFKQFHKRSDLVLKHLLDNTVIFEVSITIQENSINGSNLLLLQGASSAS